MDSFVGGSSEAKGSSKKIISGSVAKALARLVRCASPPEILLADREARCPIPNNARCSSTKAGPGTPYPSDLQPRGHIVIYGGVEEQRLLEHHGQAPSVCKEFGPVFHGPAVKAEPSMLESHKTGQA